MSYVIPINQNTIHLAAAMSGASVDELNEKVFESHRKMKREQDIEWACDFFREDLNWYHATMNTVAAIKGTLPEGVGYKEKAIKMYGWVQAPNGRLSIPMELDHEYAHAHAVELILTNPSLYLKVISWD
ncbi:MAG: hypothetical protein HQM07_07595 [Zetaproteobacteria bacterium]|nr:hypothetical protein [Zetaproteobacteria bacterium]